MGDELHVLLNNCLIYISKQTATKAETVADSEKTYQCDLVLLAMGFLGPEKTVLSQLDLEEDPRSNIRTPHGKYETSIPRVYAAGG